MAYYCMTESDHGSGTVEHSEGITAEQTAQRKVGTVVDSGPYDDYEQACDALVALQLELDDDDDGSDIPGTQASESRPESSA